MELSPERGGDGILTPIEVHSDLLLFVTLLLKAPLLASVSELHKIAFTEREITQTENTNAQMLHYARECVAYKVNIKASQKDF